MQAPDVARQTRRLVIHHGDNGFFGGGPDCRGRYGRSFTLNEIVTLDPDHYEESRADCMLFSES